MENSLQDPWPVAPNRVFQALMFKSSRSNSPVFKANNFVRYNQCRSYHQDKMWFQTLKFLFRWNKSIYKTLWLQTTIYTGIYYALGLVYRHLLDESEKRMFEKISVAFSKLPDTVTLVLILGFIATQVMSRWWSLYSTIPGTAKIITSAQFYVKPSIANRSEWFRTLARYVLLSWLLFMRTMCRPMKKKFPTYESIRQVGLILPHEIDYLKALSKHEDESKCSLYVVNWAIYLVKDGKDKGFFENSNDVARVFEPILAFKKSCSSVLKYRITEFPPKFFQLVTIAVLAFGIFTLMGRQFVDPLAKDKVLFIEYVYYIPLLPTLQYLVFLAWLRLALEADDALGEDDTDFNMLTVFENHIEAADNLLRIMDQDQYNPTFESLTMTHLTLFKRDDEEKVRPLKLSVTHADLDSVIVHTI